MRGRAIAPDTHAPLTLAKVQLHTRGFDEDEGEKGPEEEEKGEGSGADH
jgi:hypothetical protein